MAALELVREAGGIESEQSKALYHEGSTRVKFASLPTEATLLLVTRRMVLCAGLGSRLRPLTHELPKPLLPIGDRTLLDHALTALEGSGMKGPVLINVHHLAQAFVDRKVELETDVTLVHENELRGTAGGIAGARPLLGPSPIVVLNADVLLSSVPKDFARVAAGGELVLAVAPRPPGAGSVGIGASGHVVRLRGQRFGQELEGGEYVGLLAIGEAALADLPEIGCLIEDFALPRLRAGGRVLTYRFDGEYAFPCDSVDEYFAENLSWLARRKLRSFAAEGARIAAGIELEDTLVGRRAQVRGRGALRRVLVLPGAQCTAPLADSIVLPSGRVFPMTAHA